jgi:hypothetical protein
VAVGGGLAKIGGGAGTVVTISYGLPRKTYANNKLDPFDGVACPKRTTCYGATTEALDGAVVTLKGGVPGMIHKITSSSQMGAVACSSSSTCLAVGGSFSSGPTGILVKLSNGTPGKATKAKGVSGLGAVSCSPSGACVAVGNNADMSQGYLVTMKI